MVDVVGARVYGTDACCPIRECSDRWPSARVSAVSLALRGCGAWGCFTDLPIALRKGEVLNNAYTLQASLTAPVGSRSRGAARMATRPSKRGGARKRGEGGWLVAAPPRRSWAPQPRARRGPVRGLGRRRPAKGVGYRRLEGAGNRTKSGLPVARSRPLVLEHPREVAAASDSLSLARGGPQ